MKRAYAACIEGDDEPDWICFGTYDEYVKVCEFWNITPLSLKELKG